MNSLTKWLTLVKSGEGSPRSDHERSSRRTRLQTALQTHIPDCQTARAAPPAMGAEHRGDTHREEGAASSKN